MQEAATVKPERTRSSGEEEERTIEVEVVWAEPSRQVLRTVSVAPGATLREVVEMGSASWAATRAAGRNTAAEDTSATVLPVMISSA